MTGASSQRASVRLPSLDLVVALTLAWLMVLARSWVYLWYPHASFDSDQAVVGLMAKHLSEGRAFPLYLYGYSYMLAVESWLTVPYFWVAGPTAAALRASLIGTNLAVVTLLIWGLVRFGGLRPLVALVPVVFFAFAPPDTTGLLIDASGGTVEPFMWVLILWLVRDRPLLFGAILAVGFLNREFTVYAVPVLIAGQIWSRSLFTHAVLRRWLFSLVAFVAVWQTVQVVTPLADLMGPGTAGAGQAMSSAQMSNLTQRMRIDVLQMPGNTWTLLRGEVLTLLNGHPSNMIAPQGRTWMGWALGVFALVGLGRLIWLARRGTRSLSSAAMGWYLLGVGLMAVLGYALTRPTVVITHRYLVLCLYIPVGLTAVWLALEPRRVVRGTVTAFVALWAVVAGVDSWRQFETFATKYPIDPMQEIIAALDQRGVTVAEADHWRAYKLTFLTGERIKVASTDVVRITEYQTLAAARGPDLVTLQRTPCPGEEPIGGLYICGGR